MGPLVHLVWPWEGQLAGVVLLLPVCCIMSYGALWGWGVGVPDTARLHDFEEPGLVPDANGGRLDMKQAA